MTSISTLGKLAAGLSLAAFLSACGGGGAAVDAAKGAATDAVKDASAGSSTGSGDSMALRCPDDKILASPDDYKAVIFPEIGSDYARFHAENGSRDDVITTASGLQYKVAQEGLSDGASPEGGQVVTVHYHGYFPDGNVFDSSYARGETIDFPANAVIPGWVESLQAMKTCEARTLYIPGSLAYGPQGRPGIPPNATLLFNVQLIGVNK